MDDIMHIPHFNRKAHCMDTIHKFHIYKETAIDNQLFDKLTISQNKTTKVIMENERSDALPFTGLQAK
jgi:hypothetical protein